MNTLNPDITTGRQGQTFALTDRAFVFCKVYNIFLRKEFLEYYLLNKTFMALRGCGPKLNKELVQLAEKHLSQSEDRYVTNQLPDITTIPDLPIMELKDVLSARAYNICGFNGLLTLHQIIHFYITHKSFGALRTCGESTSSELSAMCVNALKGNLPTQGVIEKSVDERIEQGFNCFDNLKLATFNLFVCHCAELLSVRGKNHWQQLANSYASKEELYRAVLFRPFDFTAMQYAGDKTATELELLKIRVNQFISELSLTVNRSALTKKYIVLFVRDRFNLHTYEDEAFAAAFDERNETCYLFALVKLLIDKGKILTNVQREILYTIYAQNLGRDMKDVADSLQLTEERVRQIKIALEETLEQKFAFVSDLTAYLSLSLYMQEGQPWLLVDEELVEEINTREKVFFNRHFCVSIFCLLLGNTHAVFPVMVKTNKRGLRQLVGNCQYFISRSLFNRFDFSGFLHALMQDVQTRRIRPLTISFAEYVQKFAIDADILSPEIYILIKLIAKNEVNLEIGDDGHIVFPVNAEIKLHECIVEILEAKAAFLKVDLILQMVKEKYSQVNATESTVRSALARHKDLFMFKGRSSLYGLKRWEQEDKNIKGGTIRDIVEEFLSMSGQPKHISEITAYVNQFRATTINNVRTNLKMISKSRFVFYSDSTIGLNTQIPNRKPKIQNGRSRNF